MRGKAMRNSSLWFVLSLFIILQPHFLNIPFLLKTDAVISSETFVIPSTPHYIREDRSFHSHDRDSLILQLVFSCLRGTS
jgi:hypothetical protein